MNLQEVVQAMTRRRVAPRLPASAVLWGVITVVAMASLYFGVLLATAGVNHARQQWATYWWLLTPLWLMSGAQVSMLSTVPRTRGRHVRGAALSASSTTAGMLACCAHHAVELLPIIGVAGLAGVFVAWQVGILIVAVLISAITTVTTSRRWRNTAFVGKSLQPNMES